jgi:hypothetical protein
LYLPVLFLFALFCFRCNINGGGGGGGAGRQWQEASFFTGIQQIFLVMNIEILTYCRTMMQKNAKFALIESDEESSLSIKPKKKKKKEKKKKEKEKDDSDVDEFERMETER